MVPLGKLETAFNFLIWPSAIVISLYKLSKIGSVFNHNNHDLYLYEDFKLGWWERYYDTSDFEWTCWTRLTVILTPWLFFNFIGAELFRRTKWSSMLPLWYAIVSLLSIVFIIGSLISVLFTLIVLSFYICTYLKYPILIWMVGFLWRRYVPTNYLVDNNEDQYLIEVATSWLILRCVAYCLESFRGIQKSFVFMLGYSFYLPTMLTGPFLTFPAFQKGVTQCHCSWSYERIFMLVKRFLRCLFWYYFTVFALHFVYVNAILLRPYMVQDFSTWQLVGLGIGMGHFFHLKYIVFYGVSCAWAAAELYEPPNLPCCVSRVYLYSVMWRRFDAGLYSFILRYIYIPIRKLIGDRGFFSKVVASIACFTFIFVWHGEDDYVLYWVLLNYMAVTIEATGKSLFGQPLIKQYLDKTFSPENLRRLHCLIAAPLHYFSMISNYFFIGSMEIGKIYVHHALNESFVNNLLILFFLYGAAQSAVTLELWEAKRKHQEDAIKKQ